MMSEEYDFNPNYMLAVVLWEKHVNFLKKPDGGFYSSAPITVRRPLKFCTDKGESWWSRFFGNIAFNYGRGSLYGGDNDGIKAHIDYYNTNPDASIKIALKAFLKTRGLEDRYATLALISSNQKELEKFNSYASLYGKEFAEKELTIDQPTKQEKETIAQKIISVANDEPNYWKPPNGKLRKTGVDYENGHQSTTWAKHVFGQDEETKNLGSNEEEVTTPADIGKPYNRVVYGAPGTGKSHILKADSEIYFESKNIYRTTFHPEYSYADFIGTYRPIPIFANNDERYTYADQEVVEPRGTPHIIYKFEPGIFIETLRQANLNPQINHLLIIEELNRANVSAVFGEVFQLLDRKNEHDIEIDGGNLGESKYPVNMTKDITTYVYDGKRESITIPRNMYIWATLNSTDDGVSPMDSAFKRRWSFEHIPIDNIGAVTSVSEWKIPSDVSWLNEIKWNDFRERINEKLTARKGQFREDQLLAPRFFTKLELSDVSLFKNKLLDYLHQQLLRHDPSVLFKSKYDTASYSKLMKDFNRKNVFKINFNDEEE